MVEDFFGKFSMVRNELDRIGAFGTEERIGWGEPAGFDLDIGLGNLSSGQEGE